MASPDESPQRSIRRSISPVSEVPERPSDDGLLRPLTEPDRLEVGPSGRGRSGTTSSRKMTIAYGPVEGEDTPDPRRNLLRRSAHTTTPREQYQDEEERAINHTDRLWTPWSLRIWTLIALILFFVLSIAVLEILSYFSTHHSGLSTQSQSKRYLWTYGPCAIFFIAAAVWHQVKYRTEQLMPWRTMAGGPAAASRSLLLDYISPWSITSFFTSLRTGHLGITLVLLGSFLLKVVIIASTGLLSIQSMVLTQENAPVRLLEQFGGNLDTSKISAGDAWMGLSNGNGSKIWPRFESLTETNSPQNITAVVDVLAADLICEKAQFVDVSGVGCFNSNSSICDMRWVFNAIASPESNCKFVNNMAWVSVGPPRTGVRRFGLLARARCNNETTLDSGRLIITTGYLKWDPESTDTQQFQNATASICKPTLSLQRTRVALDGNGVLLEIGPSIKQSDTTLTVNAPQIADAVWNAVNQTSSPPSATFNESSPFIDMISLVRPDLDLDKNKDLVTGLRAIYNPIAAQIARSQLLIPANKDALASNTTLTEAEDRLRVNAVPLRIMEGALALLVLVTAVLYIARPAPSTPRDTSTIAGLATIMAQSPRYIATMQGYAAASYATIKQVVSASRYQACVTDIDLVLQGEEQTFRIEVDAYDTESAMESSRAARTSSKPDTWWVPIYDLTRIAVLAAIFIVLMGFELLHQRSQKNHGLVFVDDSSSLRYLWSFVPAIILLLLLSCIGIVDFATRLMEPYRQLKKSPVPSHQSIFVNYLSQLTIVATWNAIANAHFAVLFSAFAMLVAPFLTIVGTGLYVPTALPQQTPTKITMTSILNPITQKPITGSQLPLLANAIIYSTTAWPTWTSDTLTFPSLHQPQVSSPNQNLPKEPTTLALRLPVLYSNLNCTRVPKAAILTSVSTDDNNTSTQIISIPAPVECGGPCPAAHGSTCDNSTSYITFSSSALAEGAIFGRVFMSKPSPMPDGWNEECPRVSVLYGKGRTEEGAVHGFVGMNCFPVILQAEANATWSVPLQQIRSQGVDFAAEKVVAQGDDAALDLNSILTHTKGDENFDSAFSALTRGRDAVPVADLLGDENVARVTAAIETLYARVMAQHLGLNAREVGASGTLDAMQTTTRLRLVQDTISTRVLEALLALVFLCIVLASVLGDSRKVLPNNPCSIAVMSSLIADSNLVRKQMVPSGSEWTHDRELKRKGVFGRYLLSLGVWDRTKGKARAGGPTSSVFGIDVGKAGKVE